MNFKRDGIVFYSSQTKPFSKTKKVFLTIDVMAIVTLLLILLSPNELGKKYLDQTGINSSYTESDQIIALDNIDSDLYVDTIEHKRSDNSFEEEIINKDSNQPYKLVELTIDNYRAFMLIVYNPANVKLMTGNGFDTPNNTGKLTLTNMVKKNGALAGINGGGFFDNGEVTTDRPNGYIIKDGKIIWDMPGRVGSLIGFNNDNELTLINATGEEAINMGMRDAVEFGPFLIVNGVVTPEAYKMGDYQAARVVIAQRADGVVLMLATDGGSFNGPRMSEIVNTLYKYGAINAANLDGGTSAQLVVGDKNYVKVNNKEGTTLVYGRPVVNGFGVFAN